VSTLPTYYSDSPFERPTLLVSNILRGDAGGAARGLLAPETLSPSQRRTVADEFGVGQGNTLYDFALRTITNPVVLIGAILALRYPIARAGEMLQYAKGLEGLRRRVGPIMRRVGAIDEIFHGIPTTISGKKTTLPEAYKGLLREVETFRRTHADKIAQSIMRAEESGFSFDVRNQILLSARLAGLDVSKGAKGAIFQPIRFSKAGETLVAEVRGHLDELYDKVFGTLQQRMVLLDKQLKKVGRKTGRQKKPSSLASALDEGVVDTDAASKARSLGAQKGSLSKSMAAQLAASGFLEPEQLVQMAKKSKKLRNYFPLKSVLSEQEFQQMTMSLVEQAGGKEGMFGQQALNAATMVSTGHVLPREGGMLPRIKDLELVKDMLRPGKLERFTKVAGDRSLRQYSLRFMPVMSSYIHSLARAWGWTLQGYGTGIRKSVDALAQSGADGAVRASMMRDTYIPLALGRQTFRQAMASLRWSDRKVRLAEQLLGNAATKAEPAKWAKLVPENIRQWVANALTEDRGLLSLKNISGRTAGYFYLSALGGNPVSASYNLMQSLLTTVPAIGPKWTAEGLKRTFEKAPKYFESRFSGLTHDAALAKAYPEFAEAGLVSAPLAEEAIAKSLNQAWEVSLQMQTPIGRKSEKVKEALMALFQASETTVRLASYEGAAAKAVAEGLKGQDVSFFARRITEMTQFLGGPANIPAMMAGWSPALKQFGIFPFRTLEYAIGPATELGSAAQAGLGGRNWGTLGRMLATSGITYEAGKTLLDQDLTHGLLFGALPIPHERQVGFPLPFIPPVLSVAGAAASDVLTGKFDRMRYSLPLLFPGGLALARGSQMFAPEVAKLVGRGYADYSNRLEDGRIPVYTPSGSLRGYMSPFELFADSVGIAGGHPGSRMEKELERYLISQRDRIRQYRRSYLDALVENDYAAAQQVQDEYEQVYPGMGGLKFKEADLRAVHRRYMVPRIELMLETLPQEARPVMSSLIGMAMMEEADEFMGVDPYLLQTLPTPRLREPWREEQPGNLLEYLYQRKARQGLVPERSQAQQGETLGLRFGYQGGQAQASAPFGFAPSRSQSGFSSFSSF